jgi:hypothetical protein
VHLLEVAIDLSGAHVCVTVDTGLKRACGHIEDQLIETQRNRAIGETAGTHDRGQRLRRTQGLRRGGHAAEARERRIAMRRQNLAQLTKHLVQLLTPAVGIGLGQAHPPHQLVVDELEQLFPTGHMRVQRRSARVQLLGDPTHR